MVKWVAILLLAAVACTARAEKSVTIDQLEEDLASNQGKSDSHVAAQLADLTVSERFSQARLARWEKQFIGPRTREELLKLADLSAFLKPPPEDILRDPTPDNDTQLHMVSLAEEYVKSTITRLPNLYATRSTTHFEDVPSRVDQQMGARSGGRRGAPYALTMHFTEAKPLHLAGNYSARVTYREGSEVRDDAQKTASQPGTIPTGLTTNGEFGPILDIVVADASRSEMRWGYWRQGEENEPIAVFGYHVPQEQSNYGVGIPKGTTMETVFPAYHGEIAIDPATGAVTSLTVIAEMMAPYEQIEVEMEVDYGQQSIGDHTYICPIHGVAYSRFPAAGVEGDNGSGSTMLRQLNDVTFTQYHLFTSEAHIVEDTAAGKSNVPSDSPSTRSGAPESPAKP